jgi:hypothetical protein
MDLGNANGECQPGPRGSLLERASRACVAAALVAVVLLLGFYIAHASRGDFTSDEAVLSLLAESIWQQGTLFPTGWVSNNGDLMLPSGALLIAPLLVWFPNGFELHAVAGIFCGALVLVSFARFLAAARLPVAVVCFATAILASGLSRGVTFMIYLQTTYAWWPAGFFLGALMIWRIRDAIWSGMKLPKWRLLVLFLIVFALGFSNPGRAALMLVFPLHVFDRTLDSRLHRRLSGKAQGWYRAMGAADATVLVGFALPFVLAALAHYGMLYFGLVETMHNASRLRWEGMHGVLTHVRILAEGWLPYLGGESGLNPANETVDRFFHLVRLMFAVWLSWIGIAEVSRLRSNGDPLRAALAAAWLGAFLPILFMYLAFSPLAIDASTTRYFIVPIVILLAMAAFRVAAYADWRRRIAPVAGIAASLLLVSVCAFRLVPGLSRPLPSLASAPASIFMELADLLVRERLKWGYAAWWDAEVSTVLSSGEARASPIYFEGGKLRPVPYMTQRQWYQPGSWKGETFLVLRREEAGAERLATLARELGPPFRRISTASFEILVFDRNIASNFACNREATAIDPDPVGTPVGRIVSANVIAGETHAGQRSIAVLVSNEGRSPLSGQGGLPVSIRVDLAGENARAIVLPLPCVISPGEQMSVAVDLPALPDGAWSARVYLEQANRDGNILWESEVFQLHPGRASGDSILSADFGPS